MKIIEDKDRNFTIYCAEPDPLLFNGAMAEILELFYRLADSEFKQRVGISRKEVEALQRFFFHLDHGGGDDPFPVFTLTRDQAKACVNAARFVMSDFCPSELHARTGCSVDEYNSFVSTLQRAINEITLATGQTVFPVAEEVSPRAGPLLAEQVQMPTCPPSCGSPRLDSADSVLRAQPAASQGGRRLKNMFRKFFKQE